MTRVFYPEAGFKYSQYQRQSLHLMYSASFKQGPRIITAGTSHVHRDRKKKLLFEYIRHSTPRYNQVFTQIRFLSPTKVPSL